MLVKRELQNYIKRAFLLHRVGNPNYYNTTTRLASLDRLRHVEQICSSISEKAAIRLVVNYEQDMINVLPHITNSSYQKSFDRLLKLITSCKTEIIVS